MRGDTYDRVRLTRGPFEKNGCEELNYESGEEGRPSKPLLVRLTGDDAKQRQLEH